MTTELSLPYGAHWGTVGTIHGVNPVDTHALRQIRVRVDETIRRRSILVVTGRWGAGKSFGLARAVEQQAPLHGVEVVWLEMQASSGARAQWQELHYQITGADAPPSATIGNLVRMLKHSLAERPRVLVLDEAQEVKPILFKQLRWLHEPLQSDFGLIFSGTPELWRMLPGEVRSRAGGHIKVIGLTNEEAVRLLPQYHPVFATAEAHDLRRWNQERARGSFRWWARILENAVDLLPHLGNVLDEATLDTISADLPRDH